MVSLIIVFLSLLIALITEIADKKRKKNILSISILIVIYILLFLGLVILKKI